jgi:hypothetical protein
MNEIDLRRFDLNLLVVFEVLMFERNVTRAADRLGRTQSAVSHSLAPARPVGRSAADQGRRADAANGIRAGSH